MRNTACAALLLALLFNTGLALAGESETAAPGLGRNAALTYWCAFALSPEMTKEDGNIIRLRPGPKVPPEQKAEVVKEWDLALRQMHEAVAIPQCDWGIDYEKNGLEAQLPVFKQGQGTGICGGLSRDVFLGKGAAEGSGGRSSRDNDHVTSGRKRWPGYRDRDAPSALDRADCAGSHSAVADRSRVSRIFLGCSWRFQQRVTGASRQKRDPVGQEDIHPVAPPRIRIPAGFWEATE